MLFLLPFHSSPTLLFLFMHKLRLLKPLLKLTPEGLFPGCRLRFFVEHAPDFYNGISICATKVPRSLPFTQYGHNKCALLIFPHAEHLFRAVTSFNAFPAYCLDLFFICEVFFFGTARSIDSHSPTTRPGRLSCIAEGIATPSDGRRGRESCRE